MGKIRLRLLAAAIASLMIIAGLIAYFSSKDAATNRFGSAKLRIRVTEPHWNNNPTIVPEQKIDKDPYIVNTDETPAYVFMQVTVPVEAVLLEQSDGDKGKLITSESSAVDEEGNPVTLTQAEFAVPLFRFINSSSEYTEDQLSSSQLCNAGWYAMPDHPKENKNSDNETVSLTYLYAWVGDNAGNTMAVLNPGETTDTPLFDQVIFCNAREDDALPGSVQHIQIEVFGIQTEFLKSSEETETQAEIVWQYLTKEA
ncbi:MAG: hypothetical protein IJ060_01745 [Oscillospiraceae bacterium]|nr:hypothetical protein [Oscillospiraceae bacterium]